MDESTLQAGSGDLTSVCVRGRWITLRPVERADFRTFFTWQSDITESHLWTTQGRRIVTFEQFVPEFERRLRDSIVLLADDLRTEQPVGFTRAYNINFVDGTVYGQTFVAREYRRRPHVWELAALFAEYVFKQFPMRKLYAEAPAHNEYALRLYARVGFKNEGRLRDHIWHDQQYWDWHVTSLSREDWLTARQRAQILLQVEEDVLTSRQENGSNVLASTGDAR